jgi:dephospho-CoA kinase
VTRVAVTGGIGSGKSTVAELLAEQGAVVVSADAIARELAAPGQPALAEIVAEFGRGILTPGGMLDRAALAGIVFDDPDRLAALNGIMHPRIADRSRQLLAAAPEGAVVVYDLPLLAEQNATSGWDHIIVVEADEADRIDRVRRSRGLSEAEVRARMAAQTSDARRRAVADSVVRNDGDLEDLAEQVHAIWLRLTDRG